MPTSSASSAAASDELERGRQPLLEQRRHRAPLAQRQAEIALHGVAGEARELHVERLVEPEVGAQPRPVFDGRVLADHERHRIAGEVEQPERDERHDRHDRGGLQDAAQDEGEHGSSRRSVAPAAVTR